MLIVKNLTLRLNGQPLLRDVDFFGRSGRDIDVDGPLRQRQIDAVRLDGGRAGGRFPRRRGELWLDNQRCDSLPTERRRIGILFQDALLFDHFSVGQNLRLALPADVQRSQRKPQVEQALERAGLEGFYSRDPATLSGGQRARVSLMRALLARPRALLLDEPFNRLDIELRADFRRWVFDELARLAIPALLVTHDRRTLPSAGAVCI